MILVFTSSEKQGKLYQVQILTQECAYVCRVFSLSGSRYHFYSSHNSWWITPGLSVLVPLEFRHSEELGKLLVYSKVTRKCDNGTEPWNGDLLCKVHAYMQQYKSLPNCGKLFVFLSQKLSFLFTRCYLASCQQNFVVTPSGKFLLVKIVTDY